MSGDEYQTISSGSYLVKVPKKYEIIKHDIYGEQQFFFDSPAGQKVQALFRSKADIERFKGFYSYEIRFGKHWLVFYSENGARKPEDLKGFLESQSRERTAVNLYDYHVGDIKGKTVGSYSKEYSGISWWLKKGDCMICFSFQGPGEPSDEVRKCVSQIIKTIEYSSQNG